MPAAPGFVATGIEAARRIVKNLLTVITVASLIKSRRDPIARAHAGAVLGAAVPPIGTALLTVDRASGPAEAAPSGRWGGVPYRHGAGGGMGHFGNRGCHGAER